MTAPPSKFPALVEHLGRARARPRTPARRRLRAALHGPSRADRRGARRRRGRRRVAAQPPRAPLAGLGRRERGEGGRRAEHDPRRSERPAVASPRWRAAWSSATTAPACRSGRSPTRSPRGASPSEVAAGRASFRPLRRRAVPVRLHRPDAERGAPVLLPALRLLGRRTRRSGPAAPAPGLRLSHSVRGVGSSTTTSSRKEHHLRLLAAAHPGRARARPGRLRRPAGRRAPTRRSTARAGSAPAASRFRARLRGRLHPLAVLRRQRWPART